MKMFRAFYSHNQRRTTKKHRVFIGLAEISGYTSKLGTGFTELGIFNEVICLNNYYSYDIKNENYIAVEYKKKNKLVKKSKNAINKQVLRLYLLLLKIILFIYSIVKFNTFIFISSYSFFNLSELFFLKKILNKKIIFILLGSDSRPWYLNGWAYSKSRKIPINELYSLVRKQKKSIETIDKYADYIVDHPPAAQFHERRIIPFLRLGFPINLKENTFIHHENETIKILHAPSFPECKGSSIFLEIIEHLKSKENIKLDYIMLVNKKNEEVINLLQTSDILLDEVYSDTPMAGLASEASFYGCPSIVGSYTSKDQLGIPPELIPPTVFINPDNLKETILDLIKNKAMRELIGNECEVFVKTEWAPIKVAEKFCLILDGKIPHTWFFDPKQINWFSGWGISRKKLKKELRNYIRIFGLKGLFLKHNPNLISEIIMFSTNDQSEEAL